MAHIRLVTGSRRGGDSIGHTSISCCIWGLVVSILCKLSGLDIRLCIIGLSIICCKSSGLLISCWKLSIDFSVDTHTTNEFSWYYYIISTSHSHQWTQNDRNKSRQMLTMLYVHAQDVISFTWLVEMSHFKLILQHNTQHNLILWTTTLLRYTVGKGSSVH